MSVAKSSSSQMVHHKKSWKTDRLAHCCNYTTHTQTGKLAANNQRKPRRVSRRCSSGQLSGLCQMIMMHGYLMVGGNCEIGVCYLVAGGNCAPQQTRKARADTRANLHSAKALHYSARRPARTRPNRSTVRGTFRRWIGSESNPKRARYRVADGFRPLRFLRSMLAPACPVHETIPRKVSTQMLRQGIVELQRLHDAPTEIAHYFGVADLRPLGNQRRSVFKKVRRVAESVHTGPRLLRYSRSNGRRRECLLGCNQVGKAGCTGSSEWACSVGKIRP
ncbi:hypothetical protein SAMN05216176_10315 [Nitratireductor indicus]|nr:hypothetical protein SAMN05216176_10315 [Nitratireductor indicus]